MPASAEQMAMRRWVVIDAAERMIRETGTTDFTMAALAQNAGVSPTTPYNLFESKSALLYALLNRSMDGVDELGRQAGNEPDPFVRSMRYAEDVARFFAADSHFYRVLYRFLLGAKDPVHRPAFMERAINYWKQPAKRLEQQGLLPSEFPGDQLALEMMTSFIGTTELWAHGELSDGDYAARAAYGSLVLVLGAARGEARKQVLGLMQQCRHRLSENSGIGPQHSAVASSHDARG